MKKKLLKSVLFAALVAFFGAGAAWGQTHTATLSWVDTQNPTTATTYTVYRATGLCSGTPAFSKLASSVTGTTYADATVIAGNYCYQVTAVVNGVESAPSNQALAPVPAFPPQQLSVTVK